LAAERSDLPGLPRRLFQQGTLQVVPLENAFWSIDDFLNWRCAPDENFMPALATLRHLILAEKVEITGWRCSWDRYGQACQTDRKRETIPALTVVDLTFDLLPDNWDVVLINGNRRFEKRPSVANPWPLYDEWGRDEYGRDRIEGWGELYLRAEDVRGAYGEAADVAQKASKLEVPPEPRRRGPRPEKREAVVAAMQRNIAKGAVTLAALTEEKWEALAAEYGASRDTVRKALAEVLNSDK
jgi:hypothetical protein